MIYTLCFQNYYHQTYQLYKMNFQSNTIYIRFLPCTACLESSHVKTFFPSLFLQHSSIDIKNAVQEFRGPLGPFFFTFSVLFRKYPEGCNALFTRMIFFSSTMVSQGFTYMNFVVQPTFEQKML